jgi:protein regulator of cytokinesis 1
VRADLSQLFEALSEALENQVRLVTAEKKEMVDEAKKIITTIHQMEASLDDSRRSRGRDEDDLQITCPLNRCLQHLREKHSQIHRLHRERFEQVKSAQPPVARPKKKNPPHVLTFCEQSSSKPWNPTPHT